MALAREALSGNKRVSMLTPIKGTLKVTMCGSNRVRGVSQSLLTRSWSQVVVIESLLDIAGVLDPLLMGQLARGRRLPNQLILWKYKSGNIAIPYGGVPFAVSSINAPLPSFGMVSLDCAFRGGRGCLPSLGDSLVWTPTASSGLSAALELLGR